MTSTIMYKFRSGTSFESLPMPGTAARLFDVKRAIVRAKKLDRTTAGPQLEFDLSVKNANTNEEYEDEGMLLPRGTRVVVQRLPAARGYGLLARIARAEAGMNAGAAPVPFGNVAAARSGFYEINNREDEEEFEDAVPSDNGATADEEKEIAALKAVTEQAGSMYRSSGSALGANQNKVWTNTGGATPSLPPPPPPPPPRAPGTMGQQFAPSHFHKAHNQRPNADPELARQERLLQQQQQPKKRPTGIPRTFLNSSSTPADTPGEVTNGDQEEKVDAGGLSRLQPNSIAFAALVHRGGGQSESGVGGIRRDLDYALKVTATSIPEHLQCGICHSVVKNAMLIQWDLEGRTACESCIRDGLAQNAFRCPLTGIDGVSPDDLLPNHGLRKAAEHFINDVMGKMDVILQQLALDEEQEREKKAAEAAANQISAVDLEEDSAKLVTQQKKKTQVDDELGDDDFGGDVFDVETEEEPKGIIDTTTIKEKINNDGNNTLTIKKPVNNSDNSKGGIVTSNATQNPTDDIMDKSTDNRINDTSSDSVKNNDESINSVNNSDSSSKQKPGFDENSDSLSSQNSKRFSSSKEARSTNIPSRRDLLRKRGPPQGYVIGPAGGVGLHGTGQNTRNTSQPQTQALSKPSASRHSAGMNSAGGRGFNRGGRSYMGDNQGRTGQRSGGRGRGRGGRSFPDHNKNSDDGRGSQRGGQGGRGYNHQHYGPSGGSLGIEKGGMGYNHQHYGPSSGSHGNETVARGSSGWSHDNQWDAQKYGQTANDQSNQISSKEKISKKRSRNKISDSEEPFERRHKNVNRSQTVRGNHRGPHHHHNHYREDYARPPNTMNFGHRGRGNGQERFNNPNLRGRGQSHGGVYREGNGYGRGRY